jgi:SAM-dependent methyltransferase
VKGFVKGTLVDLACGDNRLVQAYASGTGVDIVDHGGGNVVVDDYAHLPFGDGSVDTVTIVASLNYFPEPVPVLRETRRILRDSGQLIVTMSNDRVMMHWHRFRESYAFKPGYSDAQLRTLLAAGGFDVTATRPFMLGLNRVYLARKRDRDA